MKDRLRWYRLILTLRFLRWVAAQLKSYTLRLCEKHV